MNISKNSLLKRVFVLALSAVLIVSLIPKSVWADGETASDSDAAKSEASKQYEGMKIKNNIFINGIDVGGLTYDEALSRLKDDSLGETSVKLTSEYGDIVSTLDEMGLSDNTEDILRVAMEYANSGNILRRYRDDQMLSTTPVELSVKKTVSSNIISQMVSSNLSGAMNGLSNYQLTKDGSGNINVTADGKSVSADAEATEAAVEEIINADGYSGSDVETELIISENSGNDRLKELEKIKDLLGTYTTSYGSSDSGRRTNIERASSLVNGHVLFPGEQLSVYNCIAPLEASNGYQSAHAYVGTKIVDSIAGGVCQVATTIYNAVIRAELEVLQRSSHSMTVSYVPIAADAAIAGGGVLDMKFKNTLDAPVYIEAYADGANLTFNIYGQEYRPSNRTIEIESVQTGVIQPGEPIYTEDKSLPPGAEEVTQKAVTGYTGELWKHIYVDGVKTDSVLLNSSKYQASGAHISVNTSDEEDDEDEDEDKDKKKKKKKKDKDKGDDSGKKEKKTEAPKPEEPKTEEPKKEEPTEPQEPAPEEPEDSGESE